MAILGISQDLYDAGAALTDGRQVLFSSNEERYCRRKNQGGFPYESLAALIEYTKVAPADIERICVAGIMTPPLPMRAFPRLHGWVFNAKRKKSDSFWKHLLDAATFLAPFSHTSQKSVLRKATRPFLGAAFRRTLPRPLRGIPVTFVEHHRAHAASAWYLSGFEETLAVTGDGMGDGLSLTVNRCSPAGMERLWAASSRDSFGLFFEILTEAFGFTPCRDEGKLTGLAARGDYRRIPVRSPFALSDGRISYTGPYGRRGVAWAKAELAARYSREDVAAWAQEILESNVVQVARSWLRRTGLRRLAVAGGIFANVKLNQRLHSLEEVDELFVCPNMGDGGLSLGAICAEGGLELQRLENVFWGDGFTDRQIEEAVTRAGLPCERFEDIHAAIAELAAQGKLVGRFDGRMEWGPRALGNRTVLAKTSDRALIDRLNDQLKRNDFMPFAPAMLEEDADEYLLGLSRAKHAGEFMTTCFDCKPRMKRENPAVVHVDGTARAQIVRRGANPAFHRILTEYKKRTGSGVLLNTSFNMHEEPIVRTPDEGVRAFLRAKLDYLAIGDYLVPGPHVRNAPAGASAAGRIA